MIRVVVELWPGGDETRREVLGQAAIANITPDESRASYLAAILGSGGELDQVATVMGHDRCDGWATLVSRALAPDAVADSDDVIAAGTRVARHLLEGLAHLTSGGGIDEGPPKESDAPGRWNELVIDLPDEELADVKRQAQASGVSVDQWAREAIQIYLGLTVQPRDAARGSELK